MNMVGFCIGESFDVRVIESNALGLNSLSSDLLFNFSSDRIHYRGSSFRSGMRNHVCSDERGRINIKSN
jgi:hypothetical protein